MISNAFAQSSAGGAGFSLQGLLPFVLIFIIFYFLLIRPQQKRVKQHKAMVESLKRGNKVLTAGGLLGVVIKAVEGSETVSVQIAPGVTVELARQMISEVRGEEKIINVENKTKSKYLKLVEIHREDIAELPDLLSLLSHYNNYKFILLCDDLSFDAGESTYKSLKAALDGGIQGKPKNVIFYATSNRRHLMPREMMENERSTAINPSESVEEKVSLSDRFGLWIGFHNMSQDIFLDIVYAYCKEFKIKIDQDIIRSEALEWSITRGSRSGRVAWQFVQNLAGQHKVKIF